MKENLVLKKCEKCGAIVEVINDCHCGDCGIKCCNQEMVVVKENSVDASIEKHKPNYEIVGNYIVVTVNHVMEDDHYIEWIALDSNKITAKKYFQSGEVAKAIFPYIQGSKVLAYCNKHGLWSEEIK